MHRSLHCCRGYLLSHAFATAFCHSWSRLAQHRATSVKLNATKTQIWCNQGAPGRVVQVKFGAAEMALTTRAKFKVVGVELWAKERVASLPVSDLSPHRKSGVSIKGEGARLSMPKRSLPRCLRQTASKHHRLSARIRPVLKGVAEREREREKRTRTDCMRSVPAFRVNLQFLPIPKVLPLCHERWCGLWRWTLNAGR